MISGKKYLILLSLTIIVAIILLSGPKQILENVGKIRLEVLPALIILFTASVILRTLKWHYVLADIGQHSLASLIPVNLSGTLFRDTLPVKAGEPVKALLLKQVYGIPASQGIVSVMWDRVMDFLGVFTFGIVFLLLSLGRVDDALVSAGLVGSAAVVAGCAIVVTALTQKTIGEKIFKQFKKTSFFSKLFTKKRLDSFYSVRVAPSSVLYNYMTTLSAISLEGLMFYLVFASMGVEVNPLIVVSAFSFAVLAGFISFLPAGLGSLEAVFILSLIPYGLTQGQAAAGVLSVRSLSMFLIYALGIVSHLLVVKPKAKKKTSL